MEKKVKQISNKYNRFSIIYDWIETPIERKYFSRWRKKLLGNIKGRVLEVGVGTGKNLPYYNPGQVELTAVDISEKMMDKAKERAEQLKWKVNFKLLDSEKFPFPDNSFDYVVVTFVLCSVGNQETVLKEMNRVLKPTGKILLLEHVLSKNKLIALWQRLHNPLTKFLVGVNINRDTVGMIRKSGLQIITEKNLAIKDVFKRVEAVKRKIRKQPKTTQIIPQHL